VCMEGRSLLGLYATHILVFLRIYARTCYYMLYDT